MYSKQEYRQFSASADKLYARRKRNCYNLVNARPVVDRTSIADDIYEFDFS